MNRPAVMLALLSALAACEGPAPGEATEPMELTSPAFGEGETIPQQHTCDGEDVSPPLAWTGAPEGTVSFVLIVHDPDAGGFVHWLLTGIPETAYGLAEGEGDTTGVPGPNAFGRTGWGGPCPPGGEHRYVFTLYALSEPLQPDETADARAVLSALEGRMLAEATLTGVYARGR